MKVDTSNFSSYHRPYLLPELGFYPEECREGEVESLEVFNEKECFRYDPSILSVGDNVKLVGYWQSYRYSEYIELFTREQYLQEDNSISVHVRRGDYVGNLDVDGLCSEQYYYEALSYIRSKVGIIPIKVFSDDIGWAKTWVNSLPFNTAVVEETDPVKSFKQMSLCTHHVIANSTFSWWAARAYPSYGGITVAPRTWHRRYMSDDLYPKEWVLL